MLPVHFLHCHDLMFRLLCTFACYDTIRKPLLRHIRVACISH